MHSFMSNTRFILLWILAMVVALFATAITGIVLMFGGSLAIAYMSTHQAVLSRLPAPTLITLIVFSVWGLWVGIIFGSIQKNLLRALTHAPWRGWLLASIGGMISGMLVLALLISGQATHMVMTLTLPNVNSLFWFGLQIAVIPLGCLGLVQSIVLGQYVRGAWTWTLANIVAGLVALSLILFGAFSWAVTPLMIIAVLLGVSAAPGIVTGFTLLWLLNFNRRYQD